MTVRTDPPHTPKGEVGEYPGLVYLVDDDDNVRKSVGFLLDAAGLSVRPFATAGEFLSAAPFESGACVLLDERLPDLPGTEVLARLRRFGNPPPVIFVTAFPSTELVVKMMRAGAHAVLEKPLDKNTLLETLKSTQEWSAKLSAEHAEWQLLEERFRELRPRERETLELIVAGVGSAKQLSDALGISQRTVEGYRSQLLARTGCAAISEVVRLEMRRKELSERHAGG
jgi:FixJ family two-component response regulator